MTVDDEALPFMTIEQMREEVIMRRKSFEAALESANTTELGLDDVAEVNMAHIRAKITRAMLVDRQARVFKHDHYPDAEFVTNGDNPLITGFVDPTIDRNFRLNP